MTNIVPFERKKTKYTEIVTVNINLSTTQSEFEHYEIKKAYKILESVGLLTLRNGLKNDVNCVLGVMRDEFKCLRDDLV